jgi:predicted nucleic acid-binding protein
VSAYFLDSNIIVKYYVEEPGSDWVRGLVDKDDNLCIITQITVVEVAAALSQLRRAKRFGRNRMLNIFARFQTDMHTGLFLVRTLDAAVLERATDIALGQPIRGYDALQVAAAAMAEEASNIEVVFVSGDKQALRAAQFESLETANPFTHLDKLESTQ